MVPLVPGTGLGGARSHFQFFLPEQGQLLCFYMSAFVYTVLGSECSTQRFLTYFIY